VAAGEAAAASSGFPSKQLRRPPKALHDLVRKLARKRGLRTRDVRSFQVVGGANYGLEMKARGVEQKVVMVIDHRPAPARAGKKKGKILPRVHILVAHAHDNRVTEIAEYFRR